MLTGSAGRSGRTASGCEPEGWQPDAVRPDRPAEPVSMAPNPGFEQGDDGQPAGWRFYNWESSEGWWDGEVARSGSRSLGLQGLNGGWSSKLNVEPGRIYSVSFHYRAEGARAAPPSSCAT